MSSPAIAARVSDHTPDLGQPQVRAAERTTYADNGAPAYAHDVETPCVKAVVYRLYNTSGDLIYVGITDNWVRRYTSHKQYTPWWSEVARDEMTVEMCYGQALAVERSMIAQERPLYNKQGRSA